MTLLDWQVLCLSISVASLIMFYMLASRERQLYRMLVICVLAVDADWVYAEDIIYRTDNVLKPLLLHTVLGGLVAEGQIYRTKDEEGRSLYRLAVVDKEYAEGVEDNESDD